MDRRLLLLTGPSFTIGGSPIPQHLLDWISSQWQLLLLPGGGVAGGAAGSYRWGHVLGLGLGLFFDDP